MSSSSTARQPHVERRAGQGDAAGDARSARPGVGHAVSAGYHLAGRPAFDGGRSRSSATSSSQASTTRCAATGLLAKLNAPIEFGEAIDQTSDRPQRDRMRRPGDDRSPVARCGRRHVARAHATCAADDQSANGRDQRRRAGRDSLDAVRRRAWPRCRAARIQPRRSSSRRRRARPAASCISCESIFTTGSTATCTRAS